MRELSHLVVDGWLRNGRVAPFLGDMVNESARRRGRYLDQLCQSHRGIFRIIKKGMLLAHPELEDPEQFPQLRGREHKAFSPERFEELAERDDVTHEEYGPAVAHYTDPYNRERSVEGYLLATLSAWEYELRVRNEQWGKDGDSRKLEQTLMDARDAYLRDARAYVDWKLVAPEAAMLDLCVGLQGINWSPELAELGLEREDVIRAGFHVRISAPLHSFLYEPEGLLPEQAESALKEVEVLKRRLKRAWEGLRARFASTLAPLTVVHRYKTRVEEYDRERTREIADREIARVEAERTDGKRPKSRLEDVLARDLNLYLYDEGYRVLYRSRFDDLEPDALSLGPRPLIVEAKAYRAANNARSDIRNGFAQCVSYLSMLSSTAAAGLYEAHLVVFRLGGPLYGLPRVFQHGEYRVYPQLVDLAASRERGRDQAGARISNITEEEIRQHVAERLREGGTEGKDPSVPEQR